MQVDFLSPFLPPDVTSLVSEIKVTTGMKEKVLSNVDTRTYKMHP